MDANILTGLMSMKMMQITCYSICIHQISTQMNTFGINMTPSPSFRLSAASELPGAQLRSNDKEVICACRQRAERKCLFFFFGGCAVEGIAYHLL